MLSGVTCVGGRGCSQTQCLPPAHRWGHSHSGVYLILPSPRGKIHGGVVWPLSVLLAHFQAWRAASIGSGILTRVDRKVHSGRMGRLSSLCHQWSPVVGALKHQEGGRPVGGMDPQKHTVGCLCDAGKFSDRNWFPLGFRLGDGRGRRHWPLPLFLQS